MECMGSHRADVPIYTVSVCCSVQPRALCSRHCSMPFSKLDVPASLQDNIRAIYPPLNRMLWHVHRGSSVLEIQPALAVVGELAVYLARTLRYTGWPVAVSYVSISVTVDNLTHLPNVQKFRRNIGRVCR
jgi:hypothetical protein